MDVYRFVIFIVIYTDLLIELGRRERQQNIRPDPDIDAFMKVIKCYYRIR